jgi:hypothetical protein
VVSVEEKRAAIQGVLASKRGISAPALKLSLPVEILCDFEHCKAVSERLEQFEFRWEVAPAVPGLGETLPESSGLYMFVWVPVFSLILAKSEREKNYFSHVIYVGKTGGADSTGTLKDRYNREYKKFVGECSSVLWEPDGISSRDKLLRRYLTLFPLEFWHLEFTNDNKNEIDELESTLIKILNPPCNIQKPRPIVKIKRAMPCAAF